VRDDCVFISKSSLSFFSKTRAKLLQEPQYTQAEAEAAAGMGSYKCGPAVVVPPMESVHKLRGALKAGAEVHIEDFLPAETAAPPPAAAAAAAASS
jgi:hypothetical protein